MLVTLYHLFLVACFGCTPQPVGRAYLDYDECMRHRPTRFSYCIADPNAWLEPK